MKRLAVLLLIVLTTRWASAAELGLVTWGFDGTVVPHRMNLLTVVVENPSSSNFEGELRLSQEFGMGQRLGEYFVEPVFLSPDAKRAVQFLVYVPEQANPWNLEMVSEKTVRVAVPSPRESAPVTVTLTDPEQFNTAEAGFHRFPENLFPVSVVCTDALYAVVLDHEPAHWEQARRQAFMDWVRRGGIVHLAQGRSGEFPVFSGDLAPLNIKGKQQRVCAGLVVRHDVTAGGVNADYLKSIGMELPAISKGNEFMSYFERTCFETLRREIKPKHNWKMIYGLTLLYIALIGPVGLIVGRRARDFRWSTGYTLVVIAAFSFIFLVVGRRGYGEKASITTLAYGDSLGDSAWDVTQWSNMFVTRGNWYDIKHSSPHNYYSTCQENETVPGYVRGGREGFFHADIPLFSSREFLHRGRFEGWKPELTSSIRASGGHISSLALTGSPPPGATEAFAIYGDKVYRLSLGSNGIGYYGDTSEFGSYFNLNSDWRYQGRYYYSGDEKFDPRELFKQMVAARMNIAPTDFKTITMPARPDQADVFILAPQPKEFGTVMASAPETGWICYHLTCNVEAN